MSAAFAQEQRNLSLATAQPLMPTTITATGRVAATIAARLGPRISGRLAEFAKDDAGRMLDAGMTVKAGQVLFTLDPTTFANAVAMAEASLNSAKANLANLTAPTREEKLEQLREALKEVDARLADRQREEERYRRLVEEEKTLPARRLEEVQTDLAALKALHRVAEARLKEAEVGPTPTEIAVAQAHVKEAEAALKVAQDDLRDATIRAPFDGLITRRFKSPGDYLANMPPTDVVELVATDKLEAELLLPEAYFDAVHANQTAVTLRSPVLKEPLQLPISRVVSDIDPAKGTFAVRVTIPPDRRAGLVPGAFVTAEITLAGASAGVIVPARAVYTDQGQTFVYIVRNGRMVKQPVQLGDKLSEGVILRSGVAPTDTLLIGPLTDLAPDKELPPYLK